MSRRNRPIYDPTAERADDPEQYRTGLERILRSALLHDELVVIRCAFGMNGREPMSLEEIAAECKVPVRNVEYTFRRAMHELEGNGIYREKLQDFLDARFPRGFPDFAALDAEGRCPVHAVRIIWAFGKSQRQCEYCNCWLDRSHKVGRPSGFCDDHCRKEYRAWKRREKAHPGAQVERFRNGSLF